MVYYVFGWFCGNLRIFLAFGKDYIIKNQDFAIFFCEKCEKIFLKG